MKKTYDPHDIEKRWQTFWENSECFVPRGDGEPYCIMLPPPNVTGTLHMGHAFQDTIMDCLIRYHRMRGYRTLWQPGTDHAGIATQMVVERQLEIQGESRTALGREKFIEKVWAWKDQSGNTITQQLRRLGCSMDWSRERFTLDEQLSQAVTKAFVSLYEKGLIYRGKRLVNWDPQLQTAVSDLEVLTQEENGHLWHIRYPLTDSEDYLVVATTRPETMLGDTAVAVNPDDNRYQHLIGKTIKLPLSEREIPIIGDDYVDPTFGSGCVKITPAHDFNDHEVGLRHHLAVINIMNLDGSINDAAPQAYRKLDRYEARKKILTDLETLKLLEKTEDYKHAVPRGDRSGQIVEPMLTDQWFVSIDKLAAPAIKAITKQQTQFIPENWSKIYFEWMNNIQDWCISRQLWWGHQIPAWYDEKGDYYVAESEQAVRTQYKLGDIKLTRDEDVLDTWFSSALWPFSTLGWPQNEAELKTFYPTTVLVTGFDIIFFWVARMMMMGLEFMDDVPFREIYVHGLVLDPNGKKMSKSKGNVLDPIDFIDGITLDTLIEKRVASMMQPHLAKSVEQKTRQQFPNGIPAYGADALRFTFMAMASNNRNIRFDIKRIEGYRNFCNKLWNAVRYIEMNCSDKTLSSNAPSLLPADIWIRNEINVLAGKIQQYFTQYRFDLIAQTLYEFVWHDYCDWYLEFSKLIQTSSSEDNIKTANLSCLLETLETILRFLHPFIPFLSEELWQQIKPLTGHSHETIQYRPYPQADAAMGDSQINREIEWVKTFITNIRRIRSEVGIAPITTVPLLIKQWTEQDRQYFANHEESVTKLAHIKSVQWLEASYQPPPSAMAIINETRLLIPLEGLISIETEISRLNKEISKLDKTRKQLNQRLSDPNFADKAPQDVVSQHHEKISFIDTQLNGMKEQLENLTLS